MTPEFAVQIVRECIMNALWIMAPLLIIGFLAGIIMSLLQVVTSIQDSAFSTIPRLLAFAAGLVLLLPWMLNRMVTYTEMLIRDMGRYAH